MNFEEKDLAEYAEKDLKELLDTGTYAEALRELDLSALMEGGGPGGVVLHDRLIAEASLGIAPFFAGRARASNRLPIKDEHSYSLDSALKDVEVEMSDLESECYPAISIAEAEGRHPRAKTDPPSENSDPDALESLKGLISHPGSSPFPRYFEAVVGNDAIKEENGLIGSSSPLQRQPSMETLSCCGDCEGCKHEDELEDHSFLPPSPFSLIELPNREEKEEALLMGSSCKGDRQRSRYHPYFKNSHRNLTSSIDPQSLQEMSQKQEDETYRSNRSNAEESSSTMIVKQNTTQHLSTVSAPFQHGVQREEVLGATQDRTSFVVGSQRSIIPKCRENGFVYPPTPPSCSGSDSESGENSPSRKSPLYEQVSHPFCSLKRSANPTKTTTRNPIHTPLISSQPKGATGSLYLTEEEKRTLISEGYPVPSQLPLSKAEEKSLKKIRRKIKNKISAQESRRKKKEYMDTLEHKVDMLSQENGNYRRKLESLQYRNQQLLQEIERLQNIVNTNDKRQTRPNARTMLFAS